MIYLNVLLTVKNTDDVSKVSELLSNAMRKSRAEPGCKRFDVYHSNVDPKKFTLVEHWESEEALNDHRLAEAYTQIYKSHVIPLVDREGHPAALLQ